MTTSETFWRKTLSRGLLAAALALGALPALACGPYYGSELLEDRQKSLDSLWAGSFDYEARRLVPAPPGLTYRSTVRGEWVSHWSRKREVLEEQILGPDQLGQIRRLYAMPSASDVVAAPNDFRLPQSAVHYVAGAVAWYAGELDQAEKQFRQSAEFTATDNAPWPILAQYMLGNVAAAPLLEDGWAIAEEPKARELAQARTLFQRTRDRVRDGEPDPLSLGVDSLGEEARILFRADDVEQAFQLYAQQAAAGDQGAVMSLFFLTRRARTDRASFEELLSFPIGRELALLYAYTHFDPVQSSGRGEFWDAYRTVGSGPRVEDDQRIKREEIVGMMLESFEALEPAELPATDRLAALSYRQGRYEEAARFAALTDTGLSNWVQAKLALRDGRPDAAADKFQSALDKFGRTTRWDGQNPLRLSRNPGCRVAAEAGLLALTRDRVQKSLELLLTAGGVYWLDAAYVAEHVLTVDELVEVVSRLPENLPQLPDWPRNEQDKISLERIDAMDKWPFFASPVDGVFPALKNLLARRLMRAGRFEEARDYFTWSSLNEKAGRYARLMTAPESETDAERADRLLAAAYMTRWHGLFLLSYETRPDWAVYSGNYQPRLDFGLATTGSGTSELLLSSREVTADGTPQQLPHSRYSYRYTAAELANLAADYLPKDSEAFAAALCHATAWTLQRRRDIGMKYTNRYLREARRFDWHPTFGSRCPQGLFEGLK
ncbi:MAG: hypothetical protein U5L08_16535 [Xanthomonadales bacterium]|nr:hypothetical protein [Xanthomonadales bacterium]